MSSILQISDNSRFPQPHSHHPHINKLCGFQISQIYSFPEHPVGLSSFVVPLSWFAPFASIMKAKQCSTANQIQSNQDKTQMKIIGISIVRTAADLNDPVPLSTANDLSSSGFFQRQVSLGHCPSTRFFCNCSCTNHTGSHGPFSWKPFQTCYSCSFLTHLTLSYSTHSFHSLSISVG